MRPILGMYGIQDRQPGPAPLETHDHALCRIEDGRVVEHVALERYTRRKHDNRLHTFVESLAPVGFLAPGEDAVLACADSFVGRSFVSAEGRWRIEAAPATELGAARIPARAHIFGRELSAWIVPHEVAHLGASLPFLGGWEDDTLLVHLDGAASLSCCSAWRWSQGELRLLEASWDLEGPVAGYGTNNLAQALVGHGWREFLEVPGKLMALAAFAAPDAELTAWLGRHDWFARMRGGPGPFLTAAREELGWTGTLTPDDPLVQQVAACFQARFEAAALAFVEAARRRTGARRLVLAGGGALNLPTNQRIAEYGWFDHVFVPPCPGDDGLALGAASLVALLDHGPLARHSPFLNTTGAPLLPDGDVDVAPIVDALARGELVATCLGAAEVGPRALGRRSLLALPSLEGAHRASVTSKGREPWRPVAPIVLAEHAGALFSGSPVDSPLAAYMLGRFTATAEGRRAAPGVVHVDGTARVQVVGHEPELRPLRRLLEAAWVRHRIPCLVNTSFNVRGEPMVQTLDDARSSAAALGVDLLWHGGGVERPLSTPEEVHGGEFDAVAGDLVSWRTDTIHAAVTSGLLERLPLVSVQAEPEAVRRLLRALGELDLVQQDGERWALTVRGRLLADRSPGSLGPAARYWATDGRAAWDRLSEALRDPAFTPPDPFVDQASAPDRVRSYHRAMAPYAARDYRDLPGAVAPCGTLLDAGGGLGVAARLLLDAGRAEQAVVLDRPEVVALGVRDREDLHFAAFDLFEPWPARGDAVLLARVLHDWDDARARTILTHARDALRPDGTLYIAELLREEGTFHGALLDLHMLLATGGRERTRAEFTALLEEVGLRLTAVRPLRGVSSVLVAERA